MEFRMLGPLEVVHEGRAAALGGPRQRTVLAMLALAAPDVVSTDRLVDGLWGENPPAKPLSTLQVFIHHLRRALRTLDEKEGSGCLVSRAPGYALDITPEATDVGKFHALRDRSRLMTEAPADAWALMDEALALWRGPALADLRDAPFAVPEVVRLEAERLATEEDAFDLELQLGRHHRMVPALEERVQAHPTRERFWGQLMVALYRSGRQADALGAYGRARDRMADELGIDPGEALRQLEIGILRQDPALSAPVIPALASSREPVVPRPAARLPRPMTPTVGRDDLVDELVHTLTDPDVRLVTLTGTGGVGKTRLATVVAGRCVDAFPGGTWFLPMAEMNTAGQLVQDIARTVTGADAADDPLDTVAQAIGSHAALLLADNLEDVTGVAEVVVDLLERVPYLTVLATSRLPLRLMMEHEREVPPLQVPDVDVDRKEADSSAAVQLFVDRARSTAPRFALDASNSRDIVELCRLLDGVPLALELAAARVKLLSPAAIVQHLKGGLELLTSNAPDLPARQRALTTTIAWSFARLDEPTQRLCDRLAVFEEGFTLEAVEAVCSDDEIPSVLDCLAALVDASMVRSLETRVELRFVLLGTVRRFARGRLEKHADLDSRRDLLARWLLQRAIDWSAEIDGPSGALALGRLDDEALDMVSALDRACRIGDTEVAVGLAAALHDYWVAAGRLREGLENAQRVLVLPGLSQSESARLHTIVAKLAYHRTDWKLARTECEQALMLLDGSITGPDIETAAVARCYLGAALVVSGQPGEGSALAAKALEDAQRLHLYPVQVVALSVLAIASAIGGDFGDERRRHEERLEVVRGHGDRARIADTLNTLAEIALDDLDVATARALAAESMAIAGARLPGEARDALISLARADVASGKASPAAERLRPAVQLSERTGQSLAYAQCLRVAGCVAALLSEHAAAARLFSAGQVVHPSPSGTDEPAERDLAQRLTQVRETLGSQAFDREWMIGCALPPSEVRGLLEGILETAHALGGGQLAQTSG